MNTNESPTLIKENVMQQHLLPEDTLAEVFDTVAKADQAIHGLLAAGFTKDQITVVCPAKFKDQCLCATPDSKTPEGAAETIAKGGVAGAALGGLALAATVLTGGLSVPAAALLIGGSVFAGGFSNLIVSKGYEVEAHDSIKQAIQDGLIVVGVDVLGNNSAGRLTVAQRILDNAGGKQPQPL
jgi:hypothetical protein